MILHRKLKLTLFYRVSKMGKIQGYLAQSVSRPARLDVITAKLAERSMPGSLSASHPWVTMALSIAAGDNKYQWQHARLPRTSSSGPICEQPDLTDLRGQPTSSCAYKNL